MHQLAQDIICQICCYLMVGWLVHASVPPFF